MKRRRSIIAAALAAVALLAGAVPAAEASSLTPAASFSSSPRTSYLTPVGTIPGAGGVTNTNAASTCGSASGNDTQGRVGTSTILTCQGAGLVFVGPATGQIATVIGPTIIGGVVGNVVVTAGNGSIGVAGTAG
jgi:hypothetical protein